MGFEEAVNKFHDIYDKVRKKYNLRLHTKFNIYGEGFIEIYEYDGEKRGRCVVKINEEDEAECYLRAAAALEMYISAKEKKK